MESTDIGTIFLDRQLCIRKFTPAVTRVINLLEQDIGRPFSDLAIPFAEDLLPQITAIRQDTRLVEKVVGHGSQYFLLRFLPFINDREEFDGVVITLINITEQKNAESALQSQYDLLRRIMENSPSVIVRVDLAGKISFVNRQAEETFGYKTSSLLRMSLDSPELKFSDLDGGPVAGTDGLLAMLVKTRQPVSNYIIRMERKTRKKVKELVFKVTANPTVNERKEIDGAVLQFDTVAHQTL
jgi:two-component system CheB/CheR fusion protein